jgi:hypothetical protein
MFLCISFLFFLFQSISGGGVTILDPPEFEGEYLSGPLKTFTEPFNVTAPVLCFKGKDICDENYLNQHSDMIQESIVFAKLEGISQKNRSFNLRQTASRYPLRL